MRRSWFRVFAARLSFVGALMIAAPMARAEDMRTPPIKRFFALVVAYIGTGMDSEPGILADTFATGDECATRAAEMRAKYQADTRLGDFAATCLAITLTPSARTQS